MFSFQFLINPNELIIRISFYEMTSWRTLSFISTENPENINGLRSSSPTMRSDIELIRCQPFGRTVYVTFGSELEISRYAFAYRTGGR